jgi:ribosomal protein S18 acetylase RimI-like enzyme
MKNVTIRQLKGSDIEKIPTLYSNHLNPPSWEVKLSFVEPDAWAEQDCRRLYIQHILDMPLRPFGLETLVCAVAETNDGEIIGTAAARRQHPLAKTWNLGLVVVHTDYRRQGIARRMINFIFDKLETKKAKELTLIVHITSGARRLYERLGFKSRSKFDIIYGYIKDLTIKQRRNERKFANMHAEIIDTQMPNERFIGFWIKRIISAFLPIIFKNFPNLCECMCLINGGRVIGFFKIDTSKFKGTCIVEEIYLNSVFHEKRVLGDILKTFFAAFNSRRVEKIVFKVIRNSIDQLLLRDILLKMGLKMVRTYDFMYCGIPRPSSSLAEQ